MNIKSWSFTKNFTYSVIYDKRKHWLRSIFIDTETWIIASRNCMGNAIGPQLLPLENCTSFNIVHEFTRHVLCRGLLVFFPLRWMSASWSGHGSGMEVPYKLDWYGIAADTSKEKYNCFELFLPLTMVNRRLCTFLCDCINKHLLTDHDDWHISRKSQRMTLIMEETTKLG